MLYIIGKYVLCKNLLLKNGYAYLLS